MYTVTLQTGPPQLKKLKQTTPGQTKSRKSASGTDRHRQHMENNKRTTGVSDAAHDDLEQGLQHETTSPTSKSSSKSSRPNKPSKSINISCYLSPPTLSHVCSAHPTPATKSDPKSGMLQDIVPYPYTTHSTIYLCSTSRTHHCEQTQEHTGGVSDLWTLSAPAFVH